MWFNPAAADDQILVVKDAGLTGGDCALRNVQFNGCAAIWCGANGGRSAGMIVSDFRGHLHFLGRRIKRNPIAALDVKFVAIQGGIIADDDAVLGGVEFDDVKRFRGGNPQTFALADGEQFNAVVVAEDGSLRVDDFTTMRLEEFGGGKEFAVIIVRHEAASPHAFFFVRGLEVAMARDFAGVLLGLFAERKHGASELVLSQREKKVALVFAGVAPLFQKGALAVGAFFKAREVAGGNEVAAKLASAVEERAELQFFVAHDARVGGASGFVFRGEVSDDLFLKRIRLVDQIVGDAQFVADASSIADGLRAAAFILGAGDAILGPKFESDANDVVTLFQKQRSRRGRINSAAHPDNDPCFSRIRHGSARYGWLEWL